MDSFTERCAKHGMKKLLQAVLHLVPYSRSRNLRLLQIAVNNNQPCIVRYLLEKQGISPNIALCQRSSKRTYSFPGCCEKVHRSSKPKYIKAHSQNIDKQTTSLLSIFSRYGDQEFVEYLLERQGTQCLFCQNNEVLISAARSGNVSLFHSLRKQGADPRIRRETLHRAAKKSGNAMMIAEVEDLFSHDTMM